jgi:tetratricopeptide (TPR) repeat protein
MMGSPTIRALFAPGPPLLAILLLAAIVVWHLSGLSLDDVVEARAAESDFLAAYLAEDHEAAAAAGRRRMTVDVAAPDDAFVIALADSMVRSGAESEGIGLARDVLRRTRERHGESAPEVALAKNNLAWILLSLAAPLEEDLVSAHRLARQAVDLQPNNPYCLGTLGTAELMLDRPERALELLDRALELHVEPDARATDEVIASLALARLGRLEEARARFDAGLVAGRPEPRFRAVAEGLLDNVRPAPEDGGRIESLDGRPPDRGPML